MMPPELRIASGDASVRRHTVMLFDTDERPLEVISMPKLSECTIEDLFEILHRLPDGCSLLVDRHVDRIIAQGACQHGLAECVDGFVIKPAKMVKAEQQERDRLRQEVQTCAPTQLLGGRREDGHFGSSEFGEASPEVIAARKAGVAGDPRIARDEVR